MTYHQGQIFQKFKEKEQFVSMVSQFGVSKSTIVFKIAFFKIINNYPKKNNSSISLNYFKKYLKTIGEICKENTSEFKQIIKICLNFLASPLNDFIYKIRYSRKKTNRGGSGYGISRGIGEIASGISKDYLKTT